MTYKKKLKTWDFVKNNELRIKKLEESKIENFVRNIAALRLLGVQTDSISKALRKSKGTIDNYLRDYFSGKMTHTLDRDNKSLWKYINQENKSEIQRIQNIDKDNVRQFLFPNFSKGIKRPKTVIIIKPIEKLKKWHFISTIPAVDNKLSVLNFSLAAKLLCTKTSQNITRDIFNLSGPLFTNKAESLIPDILDLEQANSKLESLTEQRRFDDLSYKHPVCSEKVRSKISDSIYKFIGTNAGIIIRLNYLPSEDLNCTNKEYWSNDDKLSQEGYKNSWHILAPKELKI